MSKEEGAVSGKKAEKGNDVGGVERGGKRKDKEGDVDTLLLLIPAVAGVGKESEAGGAFVGRNLPRKPNSNVSLPTAIAAVDANEPSYPRSSEAVEQRERGR